MTTATTSTYDIGRNSAQRRSTLHLPRTLLGATWTWWRQVTIDLALVIVIAGILGGIGFVLVGPLTGVAFALAAAAAFRVILQTINT